MHRADHVALLMVFALSLAACQSSGGDEASPSPTVSPAATHAAGSTSTSWQPPPTLQELLPSLATPFFDATPSSPPPLIYTRGNQIVELSIEGASRILAIAPEAGPVRSALLLGDSVLLLREQGLQLVDLSGRATRLLPFDAPVLFGDVIPAGTDTVLYSAMLDDGGGGTMSFTAHAGLYSLTTGRARPLIEYEGGLIPLGENAEEDGVYFLPLGGEPEFSEVFLVSLATGEIRARLPVEGIAFAALGPKARLLATAASRFLPEEQHLEYGLGLYDLSNPGSVEGWWLPLPRPDSHVWGLVWSGDGRCLYFHLRPGAPYEDPATSHGLWCLDPEGMQFSLVSPLDDPTDHIVTISPDDHWLLLRPDRAYEFTLVDLGGGRALNLELPVDFYEIVRWR